MRKAPDTNTVRTSLRDLGIGRTHVFSARIEAYLLDGPNWRLRLRTICVDGTEVASHCYLYAEDVDGGQDVLARLGTMKGRQILFEGAVKLYQSRAGTGYKIQFKKAVR